MIGDDAADAALSHIRAQASRLDICTRQPADYAEAMAASLGFGTTFSVGAPRACIEGREAEVAGIEGQVTRRGTPTCWVLTGMSRVLAGGPIKGAPEVVPGIEFKLPAACIEIGGVA